MLSYEKVSVLTFCGGSWRTANLFLRLQTAREIKCSSPSPAGISVARLFAHLVSVHHMRESGTETVKAGLGQKREEGVVWE